MSLTEIAWNVLAVIGLLTVLAFGAIVALLVQIAVEARRNRRRKERAAVEKFRTDIAAYELLTSARDVFPEEER